MTRNRPIYIRPENVAIGDTIKVFVKVLDMSVARVGKVAHRDYEGQTVKLSTAAGCTLLEYTPGSKNAYRITRLDEAGQSRTVSPLLFEEMEPELNVYG